MRSTFALIFFLLFLSLDTHKSTLFDVTLSIFTLPSILKHKLSAHKLNKCRWFSFASINSNKTSWTISWNNMFTLYASTAVICLTLDIVVFFSLLSNALKLLVALRKYTGENFSSRSKKNRNARHRCALVDVIYSTGINDHSQQSSTQNIRSDWNAHQYTHNNGVYVHENDLKKTLFGVRQQVSETRFCVVHTEQPNGIAFTIVQWNFSFLLLQLTSTCIQEI